MLVAIIVVGIAATGHGAPVVQPMHELRSRHELRHVVRHVVRIGQRCDNTTPAPADDGPPPPAPAADAK